MDKQIPQIYSAAISLMGHDKGRAYLIVKILDPDFVLVSDGKIRKTDNPKKKRFKHLKVIETAVANAGDKLTDAKIVKILKDIKVGG